MLARVLSVALLLFLAHPCFAQLRLQDSHTNSGLRGIHAVSDAIAWASGTDGTILRTIDGGAHWTRCAVPSGAETLDFRGVSAWDEREAIIMSSGTGESSRVYRTIDACASWTEIARNQRKDGFWDALIVPDDHVAYVIGDPLDGEFDIEMLPPGLSKGSIHRLSGCKALPAEGAFAASNSSALATRRRDGAILIATGGASGARVLSWHGGAGTCKTVSVQLGLASESAGIFSLGASDADHLIAVGGDYKRPEAPNRTAAWSSDGGQHWIASSKPPHGYRSAVAWSATLRVWMAVGTNGSDVSRDDGKTWQKLDDGNWNAISGPFVVGPGGRIARIEAVP